MRVLKLSIIITMIFIAVGLITGIESIRLSTENGAVFKQFASIWNRIFYIAILLFCIIWLYLIHKKKLLAWWIGTILFLIAIAECLYLAVFAALYQVSDQRLINVVANLAFSVAIFVLFKKWWIRSKTSFFNK